MLRAEAKRAAICRVDCLMLDRSETSQIADVVVRRVEIEVMDVPPIWDGSTLALPDLTVQILDPSLAVSVAGSEVPPALVKPESLAVVNPYLD
jgi:hypothetical protein